MIENKYKNHIIFLSLPIFPILPILPRSDPAHPVTCLSCEIRNMGEILTCMSHQKGKQAFGLFMNGIFIMQRLVSLMRIPPHPVKLTGWGG